MDILHLVERLENVLNESRRLPLTASLLVDEDRIFNIIDQMRVAIPEAIKKAQRTESEKDRILAQANEEGERIRELAKQEAMELVNRDAVIANAHTRANKILERSHVDAERIRAGADDYAARILAQLEQDMVRSLRVVQNGLNHLEQQREAELSAAAALEETLAGEEDPEEMLEEEIEQVPAEVQE
ncbi:MAG: hypothetical protein ACPG8W_19905 [Candidatus Promineifilaceae bacterium]